MTRKPSGAIAVRAFIGLGANLGDSRATLASAIRELASLPDTSLTGLSSLYRSAPVDADGPDFLNAVVELRTTIEPLELLDQMHQIEKRHGRQRPYQNAPRSLDLDLLLYGDLQLNDARLQLPHPRMHQRAFVMVPLAELEPELHLPGLGELRVLLAHCPLQPIERLAGPEALLQGAAAQEPAYQQ
jgi:2-amino-4-hydroxy-6-hydroxymethyldihydropteridine diphosphokinase